MIAKTSSGRNFIALGRYLAAGRGGDERERVDWSVGRNLPVDDPQTAAVIMRATAQQNSRVVQPVYHLSISFATTDRVGRETMERVVDRVLHRLGLSEHEAVLVAHKDRAHSHVHVMVNRVHPQTGKAWERWQDRPVIEQVLRECEREFGLQRVAGRLTRNPGEERPEPRAINGYTDGEHRKRSRGEAVFVDRIRAQSATLRGPTSWRGLEAALAEHGWHFARRGQGLVIGDGTRYMKASRLGRDFSLRRLEQRFGVEYESGAKEPMLPSRVATVVSAARTLDAMDAQTAAAYVARMRGAEAAATVERLHALLVHKHRVSKAFSQALIPVYRDVRAARRAFEAVVTVHGPEAAAQRLRTLPEHFGILRTTSKPRGLLRRQLLDDAPARQAASLAAERGRAAILAMRQAPSREVVSAARQAAQTSLQRQRDVAASMRALGSKPIVEAALKEALRTIVPRELRTAYRMLTQPQYLLVRSARNALKDMVLGRDGYAR